MLLLAALLGAGIMFALIRNGVGSIFAFIIINVALTLRTKEASVGGGPPTLDLLLGIALICLFASWLVRIRILESQELGRSVGQLFMAIFMVWSIFVTILGLPSDHTSFGDGLRELLNLAPLLVLPILYERFVDADSKNEARIFLTIIISAILVIIRNILFVRSSLMHVVYLFETRRGAFDIGISCFLMIFMGSFLMARQKWWQSVIAMILFLLGAVGLMVSFTRTLYVSMIFCLGLMVILGNKDERRRGGFRLALTFFLAAIAALPVILTVRVIRLLLMNIGFRFLSTGHFGKDLSLLNRYVEWHYELVKISQSPILGYGFGSQFRIFNIISGHHDWMGFSHNSYLYIAYKAGIFGALLLCSAIIVFFWKGFKLLRSSQLTARSRVAVRASVSFLVLIFMGAYTGPAFDSKTDLIWVGLIWGYFLSVERKLSFLSNDCIV